MTELLEARVLKILIVDDNPADVSLLRLAFSARALLSEWTVLPNGEQLLSILGDCDSGKSSKAMDLIILDCKLPRRDGWEIMAELHESGIAALVPVVFFTACMCHRTEAVSQIGARLCLEKPNDLDGWDEVARNMLSVISPKAVSKGLLEHRYSQAA